jgi:hypothetical protein
MKSAFKAVGRVIQGDSVRLMILHNTDWYIHFLTGVFTLFIQIRLKGNLEWIKETSALYLPSSVQQAFGLDQSDERYWLLYS